MIFSGLKRLVVSSVNECHANSVRWTKPLNSSLPPEALADLGRSKSELVAENALLRVPLIMLKHQVKRPACTKADRILLVLVSKGGSGTETSPPHRPARNLVALAPRSMSLLLEAHIKGSFSQAQDSHGNHRVDQANGDEESPSLVLSGYAVNYGNWVFLSAREPS